MKLTIYTLITAIIVFSSCTTEKKLNDEVYVIKSNFSKVYDDAIITYSNKENFFKEDSLLQKVKMINNDSLIKELNIILNKTSDIPEIKDSSLRVAILEYAIIKGEDTLYSGPNFKSWMYQNKLLMYESVLLKEFITKKMNNIGNVVK